MDNDEIINHHNDNNDDKIYAFVNNIVRKTIKKDRAMLIQGHSS